MKLTDNNPIEVWIDLNGDFHLLRWNYYAGPRWIEEVIEEFGGTFLGYL